ncbi:hypothetical protein Egran_06679 [Elaphomyces granulatus]|uniref:Uncharacterized protein n=1 Tax=Elaphomyces granulatus TaxID=519963 RepID=A0A232LN78_9EURO|nr:hypothetical protein Egran_06679 [Elaphomyces granulatus]
MLCTTLVSLGLTAGAAAAHRHDLFCSQTSSQSNNLASSLDRTSLVLPALSTQKIGTSVAQLARSDQSPTANPHQAGMFSCSKPESPYTSSHGEVEEDREENGREEEGDEEKEEDKEKGDDDDDVCSHDDDDNTTTGSLESFPHTVSPASGRRRSARPKTCFQLAHPPGGSRQKRLRLRPKLLLQLQQISQRPVPVLDVLPSTGFTHRLAYKPRIFRGRDGLGPKDLVVVTSDSYIHQSLGEDDRSASSEEERSAHREVVATICYPSKEDARHKSKVEISLHSGRSWEATPLPNGSYEFVSRTKEGTQTVRWVYRSSKRHRLSAPVVPSPTDGDQRFTFSIIDPNSRRHPVIASMNRNCIDVYEQYSIPPTSSGDGISPDSFPDAAGFPPAPGQRLMKTDDELRTVILVTGIWVVCKESWSRNSPPVDSIPSGTSPVSSQQRSSFTSARNGREMPVSSPGDIRFYSRPPSVSTVRPPPSIGVAGSQPLPYRGDPRSGPVRAGETTVRDRAVRRSMSAADRSVPGHAGNIGTPRDLPATDLSSPASRRHHYSDSYHLPVSGSHKTREPSSNITHPKSAETDRAKGSRWRRISAVFDFGNRKRTT